MSDKTEFEKFVEKLAEEYVDIIECNTLTAEKIEASKMPEDWDGI